MPRPQAITITLSPSGGLIARIPHGNGLGHDVELRPGHIEAGLLRLLQAGAAGGRHGPPLHLLGSPGAPTQAEITHREAHAVTPDPRCPFCADLAAYAQRRQVGARRQVCAQAAGVRPATSPAQVQRLPTKSRKLSGLVTLTLADLD